MMRALLAVPLFLLAGCSTLAGGPTTLAGLWGGEHVEVMLEGGLGTVRFDCASGTIDQTIASADGPFSVEGTYRTGQSGPVRVGQIFQSQRATYSGTQAKGVMNLTVKLEDGEEIGPFTLRQGAAGQLTRCPG